METAGQPQFPSLSAGLSRIYEFILKTLPRVNLFNEPAAAVQAIQLLAPLREAWYELDTMGETGAMTSAIDATAMESARPNSLLEDNNGIA